MILIPAENAISKKHPPYLTVLLIILNIAAFVFLQGDDDKHFEEAADYYQQSELLEYEKEAFENYALENRLDLYNSIRGNSMLPDEYLMVLIIQDKHFASHIETLSSYSLEWRQKREKLNDTLENTSLYSYAFYPSDPSIFTAFTHMFMHGGIDHLLGNMIFLFLFGFNLELLMGKARMLTLYLVSGLAAVTFFAYTADDKFVPLVGASGAIAGLMGGFGGWYGLKNIRYFYWVFVIFDYVKLPAALVYLFWLAKEFLMSASSNDNVAYMAHFGGLLAGFACAILFKYLLRPSQSEQSDDSTEEDESTSYYQEKYEKACEAFQQLDFEKARLLFSQLIEHDPYNTHYYSKLYALEKINPTTKRFESLCNQIILKATQLPSFEKLCQISLHEIKDNGHGLKVIPAETLIQYANHLLKKGELHEAKPYINFLAKHYDFNQQVPKLLFRFGLACEKEDDTVTYKKIFTYLSKKHPNTFIGEEAKKALSNS